MQSLKEFHLAPYRKNLWSPGQVPEPLWASICPSVTGGAGLEHSSPPLRTLSPAPFYPHSQDLFTSLHSKNPYSFAACIISGIIFLKTGLLLKNLDLEGTLKTPYIWKTCRTCHEITKSVINSMETATKNVITLQSGTVGSPERFVLFS